jgi:hypothetical protein
MASGESGLPVFRYDALQRTAAKETDLVPHHSPAQMPDSVAQVFVTPARNAFADCLGVMCRKLPPNLDFGTGGWQGHIHGKPDENGH